MLCPSRPSRIWETDRLSGGQEGCARHQVRLTEGLAGAGAAMMLLTE